MYMQKKTHEIKNSFFHSFQIYLQHILMHIQNPGKHLRNMETCTKHMANMDTFVKMLTTYATDIFKKWQRMLSSNYQLV